MKFPYSSLIENRPGWCLLWWLDDSFIFHRREWNHRILRIFYFPIKLQQYVMFSAPAVAALLLNKQNNNYFLDIRELDHMSWSKVVKH